MRRSITNRLVMAGMSILLVSGCTAAIAPVDVTRFHNEAVVRQGNVAIVPVNMADADSLEFRTTANAVSAALARTGFTVNERGTGELEAVVGIERQIYLPGEQRRSPVSVGVGGSTGSYGSGLGLGIGINLSGKPKSVVSTRLHVQLRRSVDGVAIWEGRAETQAREGAPAAQPGLAAGKLADALFRDFPGTSGVTIRVK